MQKAKEALKRITDEEKIVKELKSGIETGACANMDHSTISVDILEGNFLLPSSPFVFSLRFLFPF